MMMGLPVTCMPPTNKLASCINLIVASYKFRPPILIMVDITLPESLGLLIHTTVIGSHQKYLGHCWINANVGSIVGFHSIDMNS